MPVLSVNTVRTEGVTFVELLVEADQRYRVRIENRLPSRVWPPRTDGESVDGWDEEGVTTTVTAGATPLGFATAAPPDPEPVVELTTAEPLAGDPVPEGVSTWLRRVEKRVVTAERLADADDLPAATDAISSAGGLSAVEALVADIERDRRFAARFSFVPEELQARLEALEVPLDVFARLAHSRRS